MNFENPVRMKLKKKYRTVKSKNSHAVYKARTSYRKAVVLKGGAA